MQRLVLLLVVLALAAAAVLVWSPWSEEGLDPSDSSPSRSAGEPGEFEAAGAAVVDPAAETDESDSGTREVAAADDENEEKDKEFVADAANGRVTGRVVDAEGRPVRGAKVWLTRELGFFDPQVFANGGAEGGPFGRQLRRRTEGTTDASGQFDLIAPRRKNKLAVYAFGEGFAPEHRKVAATNGSTVEAGDLVLERGIQVRGRVVDAGGRPVADASISVRMDSMVFFGTSARRGPNRTDDQGAFEALVVKPGKFRLLVTHEDFPKGEHSGKAERRGDVIEGVLVQLSAGAEIAGVVAGLPERAPDLEVRAAKAKPNTTSTSTSGSNGAVFQYSTPLEFSDKRARVGDDGKFVVSGLEPGANYRLAVFERKGERAYNARRYSADATASAGMRGVRIAYDRGVVLELRPVDARTGEALPEITADVSFEGNGIEVEMISLAGNRDNRKCVVGQDGVARLAPLRASGKNHRVSLVVKASGYAAIERKGIELGSQSEIDLGTFRFQPAPTLRVTVTNSAGEPIEGARVGFRPKKREAPGRVVRSRIVSASTGDLNGAFLTTSGRSTNAKTDEQGVAELTIRGDNLNGRIRVTHSKFAPGSVDGVTIKPVGVTEQALQLLAGGRIQATLVDAGGKPVAGERIGCKSKDGGNRRAETDVDGRAEFDHLAPGEYFLTPAGKSVHGSFVFDVAVDGDAGESKQPEGVRVLVEDGKTVEVTVVKPATARLIGTVTADGMPLANAMVRVGSGGNDQVSDALLERLSSLSALAGRTKLARTDEDGQYELEDIEPGEVELVISHKSRAMSARRKVQVVAGETRQDVALRTTRLAGRVLDSRGQPVAGAAVSVRRAESNGGPQSVSLAVSINPGSGGGARLGGGKSVTTDRAGNFEIDGVQPNVSLVVDVRSDDHADATSDPVTVSEGATESGVLVKVTAGGKLVVHAEVEGAFAIVTARLVGASGRPKTGMLRNGKAELSGLAEGRWTVTVREPMNRGAEPREREVEVRGGETATVRF